MAALMATILGSLCISAMSVFAKTCEYV